mmetsp:Transcript_1944/g.4091  ORF Transcript_1944/g.4091 Transcript_1944/m.4091 type:complete len:256 (-) Transcript_1944:355-1122(-)
MGLEHGGGFVTARAERAQMRHFGTELRVLGERGGCRGLGGRELGGELGDLLLGLAQLRLQRDDDRLQLVDPGSLLDGRERLRARRVLAMQIYDTLQLGDALGGGGGVGDCASARGDELCFPRFELFDGRLGTFERRIPLRERVHQGEHFLACRAFESDIFRHSAGGQAVERLAQHQRIACSNRCEESRALDGRIVVKGIRLGLGQHHLLLAQRTVRNGSAVGGIRAGGRGRVLGVKQHRACRSLCGLKLGPAHCH